MVDKTRGNKNGSLLINSLDCQLRDWNPTTEHPPPFSYLPTSMFFNALSKSEIAMSFSPVLIASARTPLSKIHVSFD